jgi:hypothetical protein
MIGEDAQKRLDQMPRRLRVLMSEARERMVADRIHHAAFNSGVIAGIDLVKHETQLYVDDLGATRRLLRKFANHKAACHCFICRNLTNEEREFLANSLL